MFTHCVIKIISKKGLNLNSDALNSININVLTTWTESTVSLSRRGRLLKYARSGGICLHKPRKRRRSFGEIGPRREVDQPPPQSTQVISVRRFANDV